MTNHDKYYIKTKMETKNWNEKPHLNRVVREVLPEEVAFKVKSKE